MQTVILVLLVLVTMRLMPRLAASIFCVISEICRVRHRYPYLPGVRAYFGCSLGGEQQAHPLTRAPDAVEWPDGAVQPFCGSLARIRSTPN